MFPCNLFHMSFMDILCIIILSYICHLIEILLSASSLVIFFFSAHLYNVSGFIHLSFSNFGSVIGSNVRAVSIGRGGGRSIRYMWERKDAMVLENWECKCTKRLGTWQNIAMMWLRKLQPKVLSPGVVKLSKLFQRCARSSFSFSHVH